MKKDKRRRGSCLCGAVVFEVDVPDPTFTICHCGMCRKWSGGPLMSVHCPGEAEFLKNDGLAWYRGSEWAERGYCAKCGSSLFWRLAENPAAMIIVAVDSFDENEDMVLDQHIYIDAKPERYEFADNRPRLSETEVLARLSISLK